MTGRKRNGGSSYDSSKDETLWSEDIVVDGAELEVSIRSYDEGPWKISMNRLNSRYNKLGRLTWEEAACIVPLIQKACTWWQEEEEKQKETKTNVVGLEDVVGDKELLAACRVLLRLEKLDEDSFYAEVEDILPDAVTLLSSFSWEEIETAIYQTLSLEPAKSAPRKRAKKKRGGRRTRLGRL